MQADPGSSNKDPIQPLWPGPEAEPTPPPHDGDAPLVCATGCSAATTPTNQLSEHDFLVHLDSWAREELHGDSLDLDTLLFHRARSLELLQKFGTRALSSAHEAHLRRELSRDRALLEVRLMAQSGEVLMHLLPRSIPLGEKQHIEPEVCADFTPPEISGTIRRTGQKHLWARL